MDMLSSSPPAIAHAAVSPEARAAPVPAMSVPVVTNVVLAAASAPSPPPPPVAPAIPVAAPSASEATAAAAEVAAPAVAPGIAVAAAPAAAVLVVAGAAPAPKKPKHSKPKVPKSTIAKQPRQPKAPKAPRPLLHTLALAFKRHPKPTTKQLNAVCKEAGLPREHVQHWFVQRRALEKEWFAGGLTVPAVEGLSEDEATLAGTTEPGSPHLSASDHASHEDEADSFHQRSQSPLTAGLTLEDVHGAMHFLLDEERVGYTDEKGAEFLLSNGLPSLVDGDQQADEVDFMPEDFLS